MATPDTVNTAPTQTPTLNQQQQRQKQNLQHQSPTSTTTARSEPRQDLANGSLSLPPPETGAADADAASERISKSVNDLNSFAIAIQAFKARYDELQNHLDYIEQAIDARSKDLQSQPQGASVENAEKAENGVVPSEPKSETLEGTEDEALSLCQTMCSRGLRRFIVTNLSDPNSLKERVPQALRSAPKPAKLVFECIGRFFLQGSKAYTKDSPMVRTRQASVLALEYYLMSGCVGNETGVEASLKEEANSAAIAWRKRLIVEGGVAKASEADARGLVLFIACFGIPVVFRNEDLWNLVKLSNAREIKHALQRSQALVKRASEIADGMMKKGSVVEAVDLAYTFGFEEKFSPQITLTSFLQKSEDAWKKTKQEAHDFPSVLKQANENYLAALKSVVNCLEGHKIDFIKLLPGWELKDKITNLEKDIGYANKKVEENMVVPKRKVDKLNSSNKVKIPEAKRLRFPVKDPSVTSPSVTGLQEQRIAKHMDGNSSYDGSLAAHLLDGRAYGYSNNYPAASSLQIGSIAGSLPESYLGGTIASGVNMVGGAIAGSAMSAGIGAPAGSYSGYKGDMLVDNVGTVLNRNSHLYRWHGIGEGVSSNDWSAAQSYAGQASSARVNNLYGADGFAGLPDHPSIRVASRSGGSDLYSFADAVFD